MRSVGRPNAGRSVCTGSDRCSGIQCCSTAITNRCACRSCNLILVVGLGVSFDVSASNVSICILITVEGMAVVAFYLSASGTRIVINSKVTAVSFSFQCFRFLRVSSVVMGCKIAVRFVTYGTICFRRTCCRSSGVCIEVVLLCTACRVTLMPVTCFVLFPSRSVPVVICYSTV